MATKARIAKPAEQWLARALYSVFATSPNREVRLTLLLNICVYAVISVGSSVLLSYVGFSVVALLRRFFREPHNPASGSLDLVVAYAAGLASIGFVTFIVAACHLLFWSTILIAVFVISAAPFIACKSIEPLRDFLQFVFASTKDGGIFMLLVAIVAAAPSALPDISSDGQAFHLLYAEDWSRAHALTVLPYVREPIYAMNWLLLDADFDLFGIGWYDPILSGLAYAWSALAIYALAITYAPPVSKLRARAVAVAATLAFLFSPAVVDWAFSGMVDVPIGFAFLACVIAAALSINRRSSHLFVVFIAIAGFFIGMKTSLFLFIPFFIAAIIIVGRYLKLPTKSTIYSLCLFVVVVSPWYVRNFALTGDPISPVLNNLIQGKDTYWSREDVNSQLADLPSAAKAFPDVLMLPIDMVFHTSINTFREPGVPLLYLFIYAPFIALAYLAYRFSAGGSRSARSYEFLLITSSLVYAIVYWAATSTLARYADVFVALFSACFGIFCSMLIVRKVFFVPVLAASILLAIPSPSGIQWLSFIERLRFASLGLEHGPYLTNFLDGYNAAEYATAHRDKTINEFNLYEVGTGNLCTMLRESDIHCVGDYFGPSRFEDLTISIFSGSVAEYVRRFRLSGFIIRRGNQPMPPLTVATLWRQLKPLGFTFTTVDNDYFVFLKQKGS